MKISWQPKTRLIMFSNTSKEMFGALVIYAPSAGTHMPPTCTSTEGLFSAGESVGVTEQRWKHGCCVQIQGLHRPRR